MPSAPHPDASQGLLRRRLAEPAIMDLAARRRRLVLAGLLVVGSVLLFTRVWDWWLEHEDLSRLDTPLMRWLTEHRDPLVTSVLVVITTVTAPTGMILISLATVLVWLWRSTHWWRPVLLAGSMLLAVTGIVGVKWIVERRRPPIADMLLGADHSFSFPSGHTLATTTFVLVLVYLLYFRPRAVTPRFAADDAALRSPAGAVPTSPGDHGVRQVAATTRPEPRRGRWWALLGAVTVIAVVAFSCLYLGYHWLTDVTGAFLLALAVLGVVIGVDAWRPTAPRHRGCVAVPRGAPGTTER
ncbi:phosphatase PAP2 family protein [Kocuria salsicia]|uniref:phosphatase PAP2 family protein n=1 Tax=Kocuria salsicia TaxID=664639 RepID=UPI0011A7A6FA|nr:phosphatase PAP2 family protein [Kocuria salsicia]